MITEKEIHDQWLIEYHKASEEMKGAPLPIAYESILRKMVTWFFLKLQKEVLREKN